MAFHVENRSLNRMVINPNYRHELKVWGCLFNCRLSEIKNAVAQVGNSAGAVKKYIDQKYRQ